MSQDEKLLYGLAAIFVGFCAVIIVMVLVS